MKRMWSTPGYVRVLCSCLGALIFCLARLALADAPQACVPDPSAPPATSPDDSPGSGAALQAIVQRLDGLMDQAWKAAGVEPSAPATDAEFLRRAYLDLTGMIPTVGQAREFLADSRPNKQDLLIDELVASPAHATHLAATWRKILLPADAMAVQFQGVGPFQDRLRAQFAQNVRYDNIVADILVATGTPQQSSATLFYTVHELKPEELAAATSRIFLGVQIQCAQCHDHPFDKWKQQDFWSLAAFFARIRSEGMERGPMTAGLADVNEGEVFLPDTQTVVPPKYLGADPAGEDALSTRRQQLALWIVSRENQYFARAAVNRVWAQLFGRGLAEPLDDLGDHNPASIPEVLETLSDWFCGSGYDVQALYRALGRTRAYRLAGTTSAQAQDVPAELFARMALKPLTGEQLFDCIARATRRPVVVPANPDDPFGSMFADPARLEFLLQFQSAMATGQGSPAGIPQVLTLMNGRLTSEVTDVSKGSLLAALEAPFLSDEDRVEVLCLATLSRQPTDAELAEWSSYVRSQGDQGRRDAYADLLWALVNCVEFGFNH